MVCFFYDSFFHTCFGIKFTRVTLRLITQFGFEEINFLLTFKVPTTIFSGLGRSTLKPIASAFYEY